MSILPLYYVVLIILLYLVYGCLIIKAELADVTDAMFIIAIIVVSIFFLLAEKKNFSIKYFKTLILMIITIGCISGVVFWGTNVKVYMALTSVFSGIWTFVIRAGWYKCAKQNYYSNIVLRYIRIVRYGIIIVVLINGIYVDGYGLTTTLMNIWFALWFVEYVGTLFFTENKYVKMTIHTSVKDIDTKNDIVQIGNEKTWIKLYKILDEEIEVQIVKEQDVILLEEEL